MQRRGDLQNRQICSPGRAHRQSDREPLLISSAADIPLVIAFLGAMGGLLTFGLVGLVLGPLILAVLFAIWRKWLEGNAPEVERCPRNGPH
ncbi:AI-2E family transporter [Methylosinus sporium]|uniref:AI-2E family transporter n=1 Tax=Methylosinus sporium TaxID=428 RepID=UPI00383B4298